MKPHHLDALDRGSVAIVEFKNYCALHGSSCFVAQETISSFSPASRAF